MKTFNVIIKGDLCQVDECCRKRGVELRNPRLVHGSIVGFFAEDSVNEWYLNQWFCGGPVSTPYPAGTLLHWAPTPVLREVGEAI